MTTTGLTYLPEPLAEGHAYRLASHEGKTIVQAVALLADGTPEGGEADPNWYDVDDRDGEREAALAAALAAVA